MKYSIDTSSILEAWHRRYPRDVIPALWEGIEQLIIDGDLRATEEVLLELKRKDDDVYAWAKAQAGFFVEVDAAIQPYVQDILRNHKKLIDTRKNRSGADPFVIALAQQHGATVVTNENPTGSTARPKIPDVCASLSIRYINMLGLIREQGWVFKRS